MTVNLLQQSIDIVERYAICIMRDSKASTKPQILNDLASYVLHFSKDMEYHEAAEKIFRETIDEIDSVPDDKDFGDILMQFFERIKHVDEELMAKEVTEKYLHFIKTLQNQNLKIDDDITAVSQNLNTVDPISKLPITDPVRNKICGHVYEKSTIYELIDCNPKTRCPIAGCDAPDFLKKSDLMADTALKRVISQAVTNPQKKVKLTE